MFETILVPTDGSEHANKAVKLAADIAAKYKAQMVLLHVLPEGPLPEEIRRMARTEHLTSNPVQGGAPLSPEGKFPASTIFGKDAETKEQVHEVRQYLGEQILRNARKIADREGVQNIVSIVEDGDPTDQILRHAEEKNANLIVMGSRGLGNIKGLLMGSVSHKVSQMSPCSCITVK